jgi:hypothetical protein
MMARAALLFVFAMLVCGQGLPPMDVLPPVEVLVEQAISATAEQTSLLPEFTFDLESTAQEFDKKGTPKKLTTTTGETYMSALRNLDIALAINGKALPQKEIQRSRDQAVKQMDADYQTRRRQTAKGQSVRNFGALFGNVRMEPLFILKNCPISNLRTTTLQGRPAYALDFSPCTTPLKAPFEHLSGVWGTFWIDQEKRVIVQIRSWLVGENPSAQPWFESTTALSPGAEPAWVPQRVYFKLSAAPKLFGQRLNLDWKVSHPKRFVVTTNETVAEPNLVK